MSNQFDYEKYKSTLSKIKGECRQIDPRDIRNLIADCGGKCGVGGAVDGQVVVEVEDAKTGRYLSRVKMGEDTIENVKKITKGA